MMSNMLRRAFAAMLVLPCAAPAHAEQLSAEFAAADTILVVGQKQAPISIAPRGLSVSLGQDQFAGVNAANVEDLMKYAPDFFVRSRFIGDNNAVPGFRGTHSTQSARALVMVDGFVVSNFLGNSFGFPPAWGVVSPSEVKQFDIVYGPYSARYPGNAMGGIINITTRAPEKTEAFATVQGFLQPYRQYGTRETFAGGSAEAGFALRQKYGPLSLRVSARRLRNDSQPMQFYQFAPTTSSGGVPVTGAVVDPALITQTPVIGDFSSIQTRQDQLRGQLRFDQGGIHAEALFVYWWNVEKTLHPKTYLRDAAGDPFYGSPANGGLVRFEGQGYRLDPATNFNLGINRKDEWLAGLRLEAPVGGFDVRLNLSTLRFDRQDARQSRGYEAGIADGGGQITEQGPTGWYTASLIAERRFGDHALALGIDANRYDTDRTVFGVANWRRATGRSFRNRTFGKTRAIGLFVEDELALSDAITVSAGLRGEWWRAYGGGLTGLVAGQPATQLYPARRDSALSPKLSARAELAPDWTAELSLAAATRFPTVGELFQGSLSGNGEFAPDSFDPNLKAERSRDANLIVRHAIGPVTLTGSLFYQRVRNALFSYISFNAANVATTRFRNIDLTRQYGAELIAEARDWPLQGLDIEANAAWIDAQTIRNAADRLSECVQFPRIPRWRLNGNVRYAMTPRLQAVLGARYASRPNTDLRGLQRGDTYGYTSELFALDARLNWRLDHGLSLAAGVNNLTNDRAWVFHPYPQRSFMIEAGWRM